MVEQVGKTGRGLVTVVQDAFAGVIGQVDGQGAIGAEQTEEGQLQARRQAVRVVLDATEGGGRKGQVRVLPQADGLVGRALGVTHAGQVGMVRLNGPHRREEIVAIGLGGDAVQRVHNTGRDPHRGPQCLIRPRLDELRRSSVKVLMDA